MSITRSDFDTILGYIAPAIDRDVKRFLGREAVEPTTIGDGVSTEGHVGDRNTVLTLREYPIIGVGTVVVNGAPMTPILPFAPGGVSLTTATAGGSIAGGQAVFVKVTAYGPLVGPTNTVPTPPTNQESGAVGEFSIFVPAGTNTNIVTVTWNQVPNAIYYRVYVGTASQQETLYFQVNPTGLWGGWTAPGQQSLVLTSLAGTAGSVPLSGPLQTGGDYWVKDGGKFGQIQRNYGWDLPAASMSWSSAWWDIEGYNSYPDGHGARVKGPVQENIVVQYTAGYATGSADLQALQQAGMEWGVARFRSRDKLEFTMESTHEHRGTMAVDMPEHVRHVLNTYKRAGDWQHPRTTARV